MTADPEELLESTVPPGSPSDGDEALDDAARGVSVTSEDAIDDTGEIDAIGAAAGLVVRDDKPFRGIEVVERRDEHRWELDPASAEADLVANEDPAAV